MAKERIKKRDKRLWCIGHVDWRSNFVLPLYFGATQKAAWEMFGASDHAARKSAEGRGYYPRKVTLTLGWE